MNKIKRDCLVNISKELPRAGLEMILFNSMVLGMAVSIGAGISCLFGGEREISRNLSEYGLMMATLGFGLSAGYSSLQSAGNNYKKEEFAMDKIKGILDEYKRRR